MLIEELGLEPEPMMQTIGQESVLSFAGLSKRNFRKLFRKKKAPIREAKQYEGKGVYMMIDPSKFGNRVDNAWQKYAESYMTDSEAGAVRIRYDKDGITIAGNIYLVKGASYRMNGNADWKTGANYSNQITLWWLGGRD